MLSCITSGLRLKMNGSSNTEPGTGALWSVALLRSLPVCKRADELNFDMDPKRISTSPMLQDPTPLNVDRDPNRLHYRQGSRDLKL